MERAKWQAKNALGRQRRSSSEPGQRAFASRGTDCAATVVVNADTSSRQEIIGRDHQRNRRRDSGTAVQATRQTAILCCPKGHRCRARSRRRRSFLWWVASVHLCEVSGCGLEAGPGDVVLDVVVAFFGGLLLYICVKFQAAGLRRARAMYSSTWWSRVRSACRSSRGACGWSAAVSGTSSRL